MAFLLDVADVADEDRSIEFWFNIFDLDVSALTSAVSAEVNVMASVPLENPVQG